MLMGDNKGEEGGGKGKDASLRTVRARLPYCALLYSTVLYCDVVCRTWRCSFVSWIHRAQFQAAARAMTAFPIAASERSSATLDGPSFAAWRGTSLFSFLRFLFCVTHFLFLFFC